MTKYIAVLFVIAVMIIMVLTSDTPGYKGKKFDSGTIVAFGDSLTYGPEVANESNYPAQLQKLLITKGYKDFKVINMGKNGDTVGEAAERLGSVIALKPDIVIVTLGGNDFLRRSSAEDARKGLDSIVERLTKSGAVVILGGMKAVGPQVGSEYKQEFNGMYPDIARKHKALLIKDFLAGVRLSSQYNLADKIHPNAEGYSVIVEKNIWPVLKRVLK